MTTRWQPADYAGLDLDPDHLAVIIDSAISPTVATARGYRTVRTRAELVRLGFGAVQARAPALLIPVHGVDGEIVTHQIRPDRPRIVRGRRLKYETPRASIMAVDVPPVVKAKRWLGQPKTPLVITEGVRKADAAVTVDLCCVALLGVWNWRGRNVDDGRLALPDWESIALNDRRVYVAFDSDAMERREVYAALLRLGAFLQRRGATVRYIYLPPGDGGAKVGLDDFLAAGHTAADVLALAADQPRRPVEPPSADDETIAYESTRSGLYWRRPTRDGEVRVRLTNFVATITADVVRDDGLERSRAFEVEAQLNGRAERLLVSAHDFDVLRWPTEVLGSGAAIVPGHGARDHVGYAIRQLSGHVPTRVTYAHLGWRRADEHGWFYLHAGGAIGASGPIAGIDVQLSSTFERFRLPSPSTGADLAVAVQASLGLLSLAPDRIVVPLLAGVARVVAAPVDFSLHLAGPTGVGKSELAALVQQHFGAGLDRTHLPGHWSSTSNALETTAFTAKDCVLVVDDFVPTGAQHDRQRQQRDADRLLRGAGNRGGRARLAADLTMRPTRSPRGLILSSGEDTPFGQSLRARLLTIEVAPGDVNFDALTGHQRAAAAGVFAVALAGYIRWLAPALEERREAVRTEAARLRAIAAAVPGHRRTPGIIGDLAAGWGLLLAYACAIGAIDNATACGLWQRGWRALLEAATAQADDQAGGDPARHFIELLGAAIAAKLAHLAGPTDGGSPAINPGAWGWREVDRDSATFGAIHATWLPCGERAGWISGDDVYLEPTVSHAVATRLGERSGDGLPIGPATLRRRLWQAGLLATIDSDERHLTIRLMIEGRRRRVLHLAASRFAAVDERRQTADPIDGIGVPLSAFGAWPTWPTTDGPEGNAGAMHDSHNGRSPDGTDDRADAIHNATAGSASGVEEVGQVGHATQPREGR